MGDDSAKSWNDFFGPGPYEVVHVRHHPAGIAPPAERDERAQRRAAERNLMDFYTDPRDYIAACDAMRPAEPAPHVEAGKTFARLIRGT